MLRKFLKILMESVIWFLIRRILCSLCWVETFWSMIDEFFSSFWNAKNRLLLISSCPVWIVRSVEKSTATQFTTQIESQVKTGNTSPCWQWKCGAGARLQSGRGYVDVYGRVYLLLWVRAGGLVAAVARSGGVTRIFAVIMYPASHPGHCGHHPTSLVSI